jgi:nicotinamide-nucleotide amidase
LNVNQVLADRLATELEQRGARVTTAESCTGGWIAKILTDIPGSSVWFEYGYVSYGNNAKQTLLGVSQETLDTEGAVSQATVDAMVIGAQSDSGADYGIAVSGIAGPGGGTDEKPVGMVWLAWIGPDGMPVNECFRFEGDRDMVRRQSVSAALSGLLARLESGAI